MRFYRFPWAFCGVQGEFGGYSQSRAGPADVSEKNTPYPQYLVRTHNEERSPGDILQSQPEHIAIRKRLGLKCLKKPTGTRRFSVFNLALVVEIVLDAVLIEN
jgi:hypothetical protein